MTNQEFDHIIQQKLHEYTAPVSEDLWNHISLSLPNTNKDEVFDEFIKNKLVDLILPVPANLWQKVDPSEEDKKRRTLFWLPRTSMVAASILLLVFAGSVSAYLYYRKIQLKEPTISVGAISTGTTPNLMNPEKKSGIVTESIARESSAIQQLQKPRNHLPVIKVNKSADNITLDELPDQANAPNSVNHLPINFIELHQNDPSNLLIYSNTKKQEPTFVFLQRNLFNSFTLKTIPNITPSGNLKNIVICPSNKKHANTNWDLELYISPDYASKSVTSNTASTQFLNKKDSSETIGISYSAGFRIVKPFNDRLSIKTGLNFSQINEKFSYRSENEIKTTTVVTQRAIIRSPGDTVFISDTSTLQQIGFKNNKIKNNYRSIDIPLLVGYQFGSEDFSIGINTGIVFNLTSWYQGAMFDSSFTPQNIPKSGSMVYKKNIGLGIYAGLAFTKRLNEHTHIFAEPYIRYNLSHMTILESSFKQRFSIGGLSLGLRFNLNQH